MLVVRHLFLILLKSLRGLGIWVKNFFAYKEDPVFPTVCIFALVTALASCSATYYVPTSSGNLLRCPTCCGSVHLEATSRIASPDGIVHLFPPSTTYPRSYHYIRPSLG